MRRWNGWGDDNFTMALPDQGHAFLADRIGTSPALPDASLSTVCDSVPPSRLPANSDAAPLIDCSPEARVRHARGQSLADWLAMRSGNIGVFPDGVCPPF